MHEDVSEILLTQKELQDKVKELGAQISRDYEGKKLLLLCILKGGVVFMADLMRTISIPCAIDFMAVSSYGSSTSTSGVVRILKDLDKPIHDQDILIVEDIVDSGLTLSYLKELLLGRKAKSVKICAILNKPDRRKTDLKIDYCGYTIPDAFVVGYGLDYDEKYRGLPYLGVLKPSVYTKE